MEPKKLMLHSVGCAQPSARVFINNWNNEKYTAACVHGFVDANTGYVHETLPPTMRGWHAGRGIKGSANDFAIGIEMCEPAQIKYIKGSSFTVDPTKKDAAVAAVKRTYQSAVEYFAYLCDRFHLDPLNDILSHSEGAKQGIASMHADPEHLWTQLGLPYTMDTFRADVKKEMNDEGPSTPVVNPISPLKPAKYRVKVNNLFIRSGPGKGFNTNGYTGAGVFTITEIKMGPGSTKGWGKLKSGAGWISMDFAEPVT